jgi:hypothetical protein
MKFLNAALASIVLSISCFANAGMIGNLSHNSGDAFVTDSLNDLEWMHFDAIGNNGSVASLLASFSDTNSELYGFTLSGTTHADLFLDAAFGSQDYPTTAVGYTPMASGVASLDFLSTMGVGNDENVFNKWKYFNTDNVTTGTVSVDWVGKFANADLNHSGNRSSNPDFSVNNMAWLAYRSITQPPAPVSEPATLAIFALGMIGLAARRFKRQA